MNKKILTITLFLAASLSINLIPNTVHAVPVAPNEAEITAEVLNVELTTYAENDVSKLQLKITEYKNIEGSWTIPEEVEVIAYHKNNDVSSLLKIEKGDTITAVISYEGDERGGQWQGREVKVIEKAESITLPKPKILPDSPFYFLKTWKESIETFFTFGLENKAKQYLHLAEVRLAEYQKMLEKGKTDIAQKTLDKYEKQLDRALDKIKETKDKGKDMKDLTEKIEQTVSKHLEVLQENLQKVPEKARKGIENAIENSQKKVEEITGKKDGQTVTIQDLVKYPDRFLGKKVRVSGKLVLTSETYFPNPEVGISDGINTFPVSPWLPTEIPPIPPFPGSTTNQPVTMDYYLNKNLTLRGIVKSGEIYPKRGSIIYLDVSGVE